VSPLLETRRPGLHVGGDLLSPDYAETVNFDAHPSTFALRPRRGNIKAALRDGVLLAEIVKQRLEGKQEIRVDMAPAAPPPAPRPAGADQRPAVPGPGAPPARPRPSSPGRLIALLADGTPADEFPLASNGVTTIGRQGATVAFPQDSMLSDQHAAVSHGPAGFELRDLGSANGVFLKIPEGRVVPLAPGTIVKAGRQWLITQAEGIGAALVQCDAQGRELATHLIAEGTTLVLGRAAPATVLDATDATLSRRHLAFSVEGGRLTMRDLGSRNGTFIRVDGRWPLEDGDLIWLGNQQLRLAVGDGRTAAPSVVRGSVSQPKAAPAPAAPAAEPAAPGAPAVSFGGGKPFPLGTCATLLDLALAKRVRIKYDCKVGDCGKCRVEITSGAEYLEARTPQEDKALRMIGHDEPESRLACLVTKVSGPVSVQVPK
jgi:pSer/pThr/pTyr-binding forkhead associated (FHA) protein/ferredoxin